MANTQSNNCSFNANKNKVEKDFCNIICSVVTPITSLVNYPFQNLKKVLIFWLNSDKARLVWFAAKGEGEKKL